MTSTTKQISMHLEKDESAIIFILFLDNLACFRNQSFYPQKYSKQKFLKREAHFLNCVWITSYILLSFRLQ